SLCEIDAMGRVDRILERDGLCVLDIDRLTLGKTFFVSVVYLRRTFLRAQTAGDAFIDVDIPRMLDDPDLKIALRPRDVCHFGKGQQLDVEVTPAFGKLR